MELVGVRHPRDDAPAERRREGRHRRELDETSTAGQWRRRRRPRPRFDPRRRGGRVAELRQRRPEKARREVDRLMMRRRAKPVIRRENRHRDRRLRAPLRLRTAPEQRRHEHHQQIDVDDRHPVEGVPLPAERAEDPRAVRRRQVHQDVQQHADCHRDASEGENPHSTSVEKNLSVDHLPLRGSIWELSLIRTE